MNNETLKSIGLILDNPMFTHKILNEKLKNAEIINCAMDSKKVIQNGIEYYTTATNKKDKIYLSLQNEKNESKIYKFIESFVDPRSYTKLEDRQSYLSLVEELNKVLLFEGIEINNDGKLKKVPKANNLTDVDNRINSISKKLYDRKIHFEVTKYCNKELLKKDFFEAVFEACKGMAERVRKMSGLVLDGSDLFNKAFAINSPYVAFNKLNGKSEENEQNGLKELCNAVFHLVRNPQAHTPKVNWHVDEEKALDILTLLSFIHKYLDICFTIPKGEK